MDERKEQDLLQKIAEDAEQVEIPRSLEPEAVMETLHSLRGKKKRRYLSGVVAAAAAVAVIVTGKAVMDRQQPGGGGQTAKTVETGVEDSQTGQGELVASVQLDKKEKVGDDYHLARDYDELYQMYEVRESEYATASGGSAEEASGLNAMPKSNSSVFRADSSNTASFDASASVAEDDADYSKTNVMVEGVDESDMIKTDGQYIYTCRKNKVDIVDISGDEMAHLSSIEPDNDKMSGIYEIYVDGDRLSILAGEYRPREAGSDSDTTYGALDDEDMGGMEIDYIGYYREMNTLLYTYDISDRAAPKLVGTIRQEGDYHTSRKTGDFIYLFTDKWLHNAQKKEDMIPQINGEKVAAGCIYLPDTSIYEELVVSSVDVRNPDQTTDQLVVAHDSAQVYMSTDNIYLYAEDYEAWAQNDYAGGMMTRIVRFSYKDGKLDGDQSVRVPGEIEDEFAIHEESSCLQVLTTDWSSDPTVNALYLFDSDMKQIGKLEEIAAGEEIYAARYLGDIVYFITYHNTDPLFAVDISDPTSPKILGYVKMNGYSDYLHPYGENLLLGIGYETDPETSERMGVKLTMFDISDPVNLKILDSKIYKKYDNTTAAENYKSVLVDPSKNLIGLMMEDWDEGDCRYEICSWENGNFQKKKAIGIEEDESIYSWYIRGLYAKEKFYLVTRTELDGSYHIRAYDMSAEFEETDDLIY